MFFIFAVSLFVVAATVSFMMGFWVLGLVLIGAGFYWIVELDHRDEYGQE